MFLSRKPRRKFSVSTKRVFLSSKSSRLQKILRNFRPYTKRAVYRSAGSTLLAL